MDNKTQGIDDAGSLGDDNFSPEEMAAIEQMQKDAPPLTKDEGGPAPAGDAPAEQKDGQPRPDGQADADDGDADLVEGEEEISIDGQGRGHDRDGKFVSKSALLRVKDQNKKIRDELAAAKADRAKLEGRFEILAEALNAPAGGDDKAASGKTAPANPWEEEEIDPTVDIFGALDQQKRRTTYERQQRESLISGQGQRDRQVATVNAYMADAKRLSAENIRNGELVTVGAGENARQIPAFHAAYLFLVEQSHGRLEALGMTDKAERDRRIAEDEAALIEQAIAGKRSPAETIMALAKASGFKMPAKGAANGTGNGTGNGQAKTEKQLAAEKHLDQVANGIRASQSLSGRGGQAANGYTAAQLSSMPDDEFAALVSKMGEAEFARRYLGAE